MVRRYQASPAAHRWLSYIANACIRMPACARLANLQALRIAARPGRPTARVVLRLGFELVIVTSICSSSAKISAAVLLAARNVRPRTLSQSFVGVPRRSALAVAGGRSARRLALTPEGAPSERRGEPRWRAPVGFFRGGDRALSVTRRAAVCARGVGCVCVSLTRCGSESLRASRPCLFLLCSVSIKPQRSRE